MTEEKQIEELAKDIIKTNIRISGLDYAMVEILNAETNKNYPFMQLAEKLYKADFRKQEWISVEERMPETEGDYLVWNTEQRKVEKRFFYRLPLHYPVESHPEIREYFGDFMDYKKITHWMPLPEPPKMKGGAE